MNTVTWLVLFNRRDRAFVVNVPFDTTAQAEKAWALLANGYGWKRMAVVEASSLSGARTKARRLGTGLIDRLPKRES